jgi:DNA polymerase III alpha subunit
MTCAGESPFTRASWRPWSPWGPVMDWDPPGRPCWTNSVLPASIPTRGCSLTSWPRRRRRAGLERLKAELDVTGIPFSFHPELLLKTRHTPAARLAEFLNRDVTVAGFIAAARKARTQDGRVMGFVTLEDSTGLAEISFFPDKIQVYKSLCLSGGPVWVRGKVTEHLSSITLEGTHCGQAA